MDRPDVAFDNLGQRLHCCAISDVDLIAMSADLGSDAIRRLAVEIRNHHLPSTFHHQVRTGFPDPVPAADHDAELLLLVRAGKVAFGTYVSQASWDMMPALAKTGIDFVRISAHHSFDAALLSRTMTAAAAVGLTPTVRVSSRPDDIAQAVRLGAQSLSVPDIQDANEARTIVEAVRSAGDALVWPIGGADAPARGALVSVNIESVEALADLEEIAAIDGVHMFQCGRTDLAKSFGFPGQGTHAKVLEAEDRIFSAAQRSGKWVSLHLLAGAMGRGLSGPGWAAQVVTLGSDVTYVAEGLRAHRAALRVES